MKVKVCITVRVIHKFFTAMCIKWQSDWRSVLIVNQYGIICDEVGIINSVTLKEIIAVGKAWLTTNGYIIKDGIYDQCK